MASNVFDVLNGTFFNIMCVALLLCVVEDVFPNVVENGYFPMLKIILFFGQVRCWKYVLLLGICEYHFKNVCFADSP